MPCTNSKTTGCRAKHIEIWDPGTLRICQYFETIYNLTQCNVQKRTDWDRYEEMYYPVLNFEVSHTHKKVDDRYLED